MNVKCDIYKAGLALQDSTCTKNDSIYYQYSQALNKNTISFIKRKLSLMVRMVFVFIIMLHLFKSKNYRKANNLLEGLGINTDDFRDFRIQQIATSIKLYESLFPSIIEVMHDIKLSPFKSLKIALLCLKIIHLSRDSKVYQFIFDFLHHLQDRVCSLVRAKKNIKTSTSTDVLCTSKQFMDRSVEIVEMDLSSILLERIVIPLICFQQKIIACNELVYRRDRMSGVNQAETWFCINLMRKIVDFGSDIESLGRYYFKETSNAVICLMKVINSDIQTLYKKIMEYFHKKIATVEILLQEKKMTMGEIMEKQQLNEFLMMVQELEVINEKLRVIYNGRYFIYHLANAYIYLPTLFTEDEHINLIYKIKQNQNQQIKKNRSIQAMIRKKMGGQLVQIVQDI